MDGKEKILYVDDETINLELFKINFRNEYDVVVANSAIKGLEILKGEPIKVVVSDLKMPVMNGLEFIEKVKGDNPARVCILLTAFMESDVMLQAINKELIFRYIMKPWKKAELEEVIRLALVRHASLAG
ncbi:MAG TPA: response regulator [Tenuifilaceae bacterium]|jgi:response regulator RpfG family c-di-GMP phosphodiesterase|nr:response regulator [Tenuifilaceae bacterium]HNY08588.1 response regulator [Tenuifilaceae bacterium]HOC36828.1 response regulator [Tenuifilaceae bacterium]HOG72755.1 response regulator [Tenuifilaceae bacterium]HOY72114.1 response regulator [Tenuifilaceae bacterium]